MNESKDGLTRYRTALVEYIREQARPVDKFSHQPRLYRLATELSGGQVFDDDVIFAAAWVHDLGVFIGHRPENPAELATWDHVAYVFREGPQVLRRVGFPEEKIARVLEVVRTHLPGTEPTCVEGVLLRDADILEQLGAVGILRTVSKVGRDTRYRTFGDALGTLQENLERLPVKLKLERSREMARDRIEVLRQFLAAAGKETGPIDW